MGLFDGKFLGIIIGNVDGIMVGLHVRTELGYFH